MNTKQQNQVTMYAAVLRFFEEAGAPLVAIKRIAAGRETLAGLVDRIGVASEAQEHTTTGVTRDREVVKAEAAQKAEILRLLVVALTTDAALRGELKTPLSRMLKAKDAELLRYLKKVDDAVDTIEKTELTDAGYDPQVRQTLQTDLAELLATQGAARQIETGTKVATETLPLLLEQATTVLETQLDPFVKAQQLARPELVAQYEVARRIVRTAARRGTEYRGATVPGRPVLVYDRREAGVVAPMLGNRSGKGLTLRYYTAAAATDLPGKEQGLAVKNRAEVHLPDYSKLGPEDAPYLLVVQEQLDGEGRWVVR
ncbi:hypothetical protein KBK19_14675 [Microvirga sp. STR05]|uniref:Uncharacterized protein n=1 Tax=Hymenobacter duratus TaxID=2771356 RepID=A0ABR8JKX8_9BACT|nr:hypothetical protein [Hymenobacter duratus]MBD2716281.1 hypothetical protein [Hymenobacter duratus]MBR7951197.1 hypothetical protein [Microvirga sp. STR05]